MVAVVPVIPTHELQPGQLSNHQGQQVYNGLDCCVTIEVLREVRHLFNEEPIAYGFERALQGPVLEMMLRGFKIDEFERQENIKYIEELLVDLEATLNEFAMAVWDKPLNPRSRDQLIAFFHGVMKLPEIWTSKKGVRKQSMDRETLEKLSVYFHAQPFVNCILAIRDYKKQLEVLKTSIRNGRFYTSYNIGGTETWRFSSSADAYGEGGNIQNIKKDPDNLAQSKRRSIRKMFISDPGYKLVGIDLEQAESREVGWLLWILFGDPVYLDACESGDLHTTTCRMIWPGFAWTGDPKKDRALADEIFYRDMTYRDMSKRGGHGTTYYGTPFTMSRHLKVALKMMQDFQQAFFTAYPGIPKWHQWVAQQIQTHPHAITTPFGMTRHFFGRQHDDTTLREAIAFSPQSSTAVRLNLALWRIWKHMHGRVQLLAQVHDALYFQFREGDNEAEIIKIALEFCKVLLEHKGRKFIIPGEAKVGWNWGNYHEKINPNGLRKYKGSDDRVRLEGLQRVM